MAIRKHSLVRWRWGASTAEGKVTEIHTERVTRRLEGKEITRNGSGEDPAYLIEQEDGSRVLKLASEVERV